MSSEERLEQDIYKPLFFLSPRCWYDFFFPFFFQCLYAIVFDFIYIKYNHLQLEMDRVLGKDSKDGKKVLFVGDSTISFPVQEYSFPYLFFHEGNADIVRVLAKPGLNTGRLLEFISQRFVSGEKYDAIYIACFQNEIIHSSRHPEIFRDETKRLINFLQSRVHSGGKIFYMYGDFSKHPIVPDNYFKQYFRYKTERLIEVFKEVASDTQLIKLMDFAQEESRDTIRSYFYKDGLHFSKRGQRRLYEDLTKSLTSVT